MKGITMSKFVDDETTFWASTINLGKFIKKFDVIFIEKE